MRYKQQRKSKLTLKGLIPTEGETIEVKMRKILNSKEPIEHTSPIIYTERKDGVIPDYDIRTDRWEQAVELKDIGTRSQLAKRDFRMGERTWDTMTPEQQKAHTDKYGTKSKYWKPTTQQNQQS